MAGVLFIIYVPLEENRLKVVDDGLRQSNYELTDVSESSRFQSVPPCSSVSLPMSSAAQSPSPESTGVGGEQELLPGEGNGEVGGVTPVVTASVEITSEKQKIEGENGQNLEKNEVHLATETETRSPKRSMTRDTSYSSCISQLSKKSGTPLSGELHMEGLSGDEKAEIPGPSDIDHADSYDEFNLEMFPIMERLKIALKSLDISIDTWDVTSDECFCQVTFTERSERCEEILNKLTQCGAGKSDRSSVSVLPIGIHYTANQVKVEALASENEISEFRKSIKARLTVAQVVENVKGQASLTFDFVMLLSLASIIAGLGLAESSSVILVASMLISPLMGPILGGTFGTVIRNRMLGCLGIKTEIKGLLLCVFCGFVFGLMCAPFGLTGADWGSVPEWPTPEMRNRGLLRSLWVGILIALPSGAGVALSVLGGNAGSLVGVAISASLLPPAVNAGMLWAVAIVTSIRPPDVVASDNISQKNESGSAAVFPPHCPQLVSNAYQPVYSCHMGQDAALLGLVSLTLTLINIILIFITGVIVLKIKEVAPHTAVSATQKFWKNDIKIARDAYRTMKGADANQLSKDFLQEWQTLNKEGPDDNNREESLMDIIREVENDNTFRVVSGCVPTTPASFLSGPLPFSWWPNMENQQSSHTTWHPQGRHSLRHRPQRFFSQTEKEDMTLPLLPSSVRQGNHPPGSPLEVKNKIRFIPKGGKKKKTFVVTKINEENADSKTLAKKESSNDAQDSEKVQIEMVKFSGKKGNGKTELSKQHSV